MQVRHRTVASADEHRPILGIDDPDERHARPSDSRRPSPRLHRPDRWAKRPRRPGRGDPDVALGQLAPGEATCSDERDIGPARPTWGHARSTGNRCPRATPSRGRVDRRTDQGASAIARRSSLIPHVPLHESTVDQFVILAVWHGQQVFGSVAASVLGRDCHGHRKAPDSPRRNETSPSILSSVCSAGEAASRGTKRSLLTGRRRTPCGPVWPRPPATIAGAATGPTASAAPTRSSTRPPSMIHSRRHRLPAVVGGRPLSTEPLRTRNSPPSVARARPDSPMARPRGSRASRRPARP